MTERLLRDIRDAIDRRAHQQERRELQANAAFQFAAINGWSPTIRPFGLAYIDFGRTDRRRPTHPDFCEGSVLDHPLYFRSSGKSAAIVAQPYAASGKDCEACSLARSYGIECHSPPSSTASIWYPGSTSFFVFVSPGVEVRWLPEQVNGIAGAGGAS